MQDSRISFFRPKSISVRIVTALFLLVSLSASSSASAKKVHKYIVYVGTYQERGSKGIYAYRFDSKSGRLSELGLQAEASNPAYLRLAPEQHVLYSVNEIDNYQEQQSGAISAYRTDAKTAALTLLNQVSSVGAGPCYLSLDKTGKFLLTANYGGGSVTAIELLPDGKLGKATASVQHYGSSVHPDRQKGPHAHFIETTFDNRFAIVADLGLDQLLVYKFDSSKGSLIPAATPFAKLQSGAGPRYFAFHPNHRYLYLVNEITSSVTVFSYNAETGTLQEKQTISTLPKDFKGHSDASEIHMDTSGRFVYVSNRGPDTIAIFRINPTNGTLEMMETVASGGKRPRCFAIDPSGKFLLAANQDSDNIVTFRIDPKSGRLSKVGETGGVISPVSLAFLEAE
jgi:6-phosphogluconolactonase